MRAAITLTSGVTPSACDGVLRGHLTLLTRRRTVPYGAAPMLDAGKAMNLDNLKLLENKINQFVDQHERVREEHEALVQHLRDKEKQLAEATTLLKQYEQERSEIKARLERILTRLDGLDLT